MGDAHAERRPAGGPGASVLAELRAAGTPLTPGQVQEALGSSRARTTVTTILSRPYEKGVVSRTRSGRGFAYLPTEDASGLTARRMHAEPAAFPEHRAVRRRREAGRDSGPRRVR